MKTFGLALLAAVVGYAVGTFGSMTLIERFSSNQYDRSLEAAMTSALVVGPLIGLLSAGLVMAYRTARARVLVSDGAVAAGVLAGGIGGCIRESACLKGATMQGGPRAHAALAALIGGGLGFGAGILLTRNIDEGHRGSPWPSTPPTGPPRAGAGPRPPTVRPCS